VHIRTLVRVGAFCLFVLYNLSTTCVCITDFFLTPACGCKRGLEVGFFSSLFMTCLALVTVVGGSVLPGVEIGGLSCVFFYFCGVVGGCVFVYTHTHTQNTWVLQMSLGVGWTPGEPEESRLTKAQYTCRLYMCTQYICLYICWAAGFDDLN